MTEVLLSTDGIKRRSKNKSGRSTSTTNNYVKPLKGLKRYKTYLANNIKQITDTDNQVIKGEVVLAFDVDKKGNPVNITIEQSLYPACDEEAKRLLMEGPRWQKKSNKKGKLVVNF